jgi:hypothetical protein
MLSSSRLKTAPQDRYNRYNLLNSTVCSAFLNSTDGLVLKTKMYCPAVTANQLLIWYLLRGLPGTQYL